MGIEPAIDITTEQRKTVLSLLKKHLPNTTAWVYGSRAKWTARPQSDLDMVVFATPEQSSQVFALREAFEESNLPFRVDLFVWDDVPDRFRKYIKQDYVVFSDNANDDPVGKNWLYHPHFPRRWNRKPLYAMAQWVNGLAFRKIQFSTTGKPIIKIAEIKGGISGQTKFTQQTFDESVRVRSGDLLFSWSGQPETSIDAFWWRGPEGWLNQHVFRVTPINGVDSTFFFYLLRYLNPNFVAIARNKQTTGLGHVTKRDLENIEAALPDLSEQHAIAHILGTLDDKIELNRRMNETLEEMARVLFKSWFVDFDPVRAKMEGRDTGLPPDVAALFPDRLVDSELGEIPEGWEVKTLNYFAALNPESWSRANHPKGVEYVDLANTKWGVIEATQYYFWRDAPSRAKRVLRSGDTIVGTVRPGNGSYSLIGHEGLTGSTGFAVLRPIHLRYRELVYLSATSAENIKRLAHRADGAAYPAVRPNVVEETRVVTPGVETDILNIFSMTVAPIVNRMESNKAESHTLAALRDTLLPKLVSGKLRVTDIGRHISEEYT